MFVANDVPVGEDGNERDLLSPTSLALGILIYVDVKIGVCPIPVYSVCDGIT
jgi:hypothetical protein